MKYVITHRGIAASLMVTDPEGKQYHCYYMAEGKPVQEGISGSAAMAESRFLSLPPQVRSAVEEQFRQVFALHMRDRVAWCKAQAPFEVEV